MKFAQAAFSKSLLSHPIQHNMDVVGKISAELPLRDHAFFNQETHDYLISKGAAFTDKRSGRFCYTFVIKGEQVRLFFGDEMVYVQYLWEDQDDECGKISTWLTDHRFSNPCDLAKFKTILNTYLNEYSIEQ